MICDPMGLGLAWRGLGEVGKSWKKRGKEREEGKVIRNGANGE